MMTFKEWWLDDLKSRVGKGVFNKEYKHALQTLQDLIKRKGTGKHSLEYYAAQIAKSYSKVNARELANYYQQTKQQGS